MNKSTLGVIVLAIIVGIGAFLIGRGIDKDNNNPQNGGNTYQTPSQGGETPQKASNDFIRVDSPTINQLITSPLQVSGEARGNWFFEANLPMHLEDASGNVIARSFNMAEGEWMTTNFVPFKGTITFTAPQTATGFLVIEKDNPSGLPENADSIRIPVKFR